MDIVVNEQVQAFWLANPDGWKSGVGHSIQVGKYHFCAVPETASKVNVSEVTTGIKLFECQVDPLTFLIIVPKEGYANYLNEVGEGIAEIISGSKDFDSEFERIKNVSFKMLGAMPPIENLEIG